MEDKEIDTAFIRLSWPQVSKCDFEMLPIWCFFVGHILFAKLDGHSLGCWPCFQFYKLEGETFVEKTVV